MSLIEFKYCELLTQFSLIDISENFSLVQTQGIAFCGIDPEMTNCEFPAHCVNTSTGVSCICSDGYVGDPPKCEGECHWNGMLMLSKLLPEKLFWRTSVCFSRIQLPFRPGSKAVPHFSRIEYK